MLATHTSRLPADQQKRLHPDFLANEQEYLRLRPSLLASHPDQWVAIHAGQIIAAEPDLRAVMAVAANTGGHPYVARVGHEASVVFRIRRAEFLYDPSYQPFAMPLAAVTFFNHGETRARHFTDVIPDTGADSSPLPDADCHALDLFSSPYLTGMSGGVLGAAAPTLIYRGKVEINGLRTEAYIQPIPGGQERLLGRDVLNSHRVTFDGPQGRVVFEP